VTTVYAISWIIACVTGVVAGILVGAEAGVQTQMANLGLKAFAVVLLGGVDSIGGAILAGIIVGLAETFAAGYLDPLTTTGGLATIFPFIIIIVVLVIRPHGLFGTKHIERI
jgi:branched-chain amino acid transport system permease protein